MALSRTVCSSTPHNSHVHDILRHPGRGIAQCRDGLAVLFTLAGAAAALSRRLGQSAPAMREHLLGVDVHAPTAAQRLCECGFCGGTLAFS